MGIPRDLFFLSLRIASIFFFFASVFFFLSFWLCWVFDAAHGLSLVAESGGCSPVAVRGLLTVVASLVVEHGLQGMQASVVVAHGLSCPESCGIFPDQELNHVPCIRRWVLNLWTTRESHHWGY